MIERLRRPNMNYLEYHYTLEDPKALTKPGPRRGEPTLSPRRRDLIENFCTNNENVEQLQKLLKIESGGQK